MSDNNSDGGWGCVVVIFMFLVLLQSCSISDDTYHMSKTLDKIDANLQLLVEKND